MQERRAAVRKLAYSSAVVPAQAALSGSAATETFEDSFAGGDTQLEWADYPMFEGGAVQGRSVEDAPDGDARDRRSAA